MKYCEICGTKLKKGRRKYCSDKCNDIAYYRRHKERYLKYHKDVYDKDIIKARTKSRLAGQKWYNQNKELANKRTLKYLKTKGKEKHKIRQYANLHLRKPLLQEIGHCQICNSKEKLEMHHKKYDNKEKVILLCHNCHYKIHHKSQIERFK